MIVNFYKMYNAVFGSKLLVSKNISQIPQKGTRIKFSGQLFIIDSICFDIDRCEYDAYIKRV